MALDRRTLLLACAASLTAPPLAFAQADASKLFKDSRLIQTDRFSVEVVGRGPNLLFIPGLASPRSVWRASAERLRRHYRLHLIQIAGFAGEAPGANAAGPVLVPTAEAIAAYVRDARVAPAIVVGHSLGGTIAIRLGQQTPDLVSKIMLVDALPYYAGVMGLTPQAISGIEGALRAGPIARQPAAQEEAQAKGMSNRPEYQTQILGWLRSSTPAIAGRAYLENAILDQRPGLATMRMPITLIHPGDLAGAPPRGPIYDTYALSLAPAPVKTLIRIDNAMHFIMLDQPEAFAKALDGFLAA